MIRSILTDMLALLFVGAGIAFGDGIGYLLKQGKGQSKIITRAESRESYLKKSSTPTHHREKLLLAEEIREFSFSELGLKRTKSYTKVYDQGGQALLWVITASEKYALNAKTWKFPITGTVTYKGYFDKKDALAEKERLEKTGWETRMREVNAWSTLGYLPDPILSEMLNEPPGDMANVIIHELSHSTVFIRGDVEESENLASFIGDVGAGMFLKKKYGENSPEFFEYNTGDNDFRKLSMHLLGGAKQLDSLYASEGFLTQENTAKDSIKTVYITNIMQRLDTVSFSLPDRYTKLRNGKLPNNAFFVQFRQYNARQNNYYKEFEKYNGDLKSYVANLREKYGR